jgi:hypothetical protein
MAYDGSLKVDTGRLALHLPARVDSMLEALWRLGDNGPPKPREFLGNAVALAAPAGNGDLLVFVTGRDPIEGLTDAQAIAEKAGLRIAVLQVGADEVAPAYRALCASTGGVALALPGTVAPELAVFDFLANLRTPALTKASVVAGGGAQAALLPSVGGFANQPIAVLIAVPHGLGSVRCALRAEAAGRHLEHEFTVQTKPDVTWTGALVEELVRQVRARLAP